MIEFKIKLPEDFRSADRIMNKLTESFGASEEEIRLESGSSDEYRALETAVLVAIVSAGGTALGFFVTGLLKLLESGAAQKIVVKSGDTQIEVPKQASQEDLDRIVNAVRKLEGAKVSLEVE